jgi:hypothetical protein
MRSCLRAVFAPAAVSVLGVCSPAQDILHYKFDGACGSTVINYAAGSPAPATGTIVTNLGGATPASWTAGRFGLALARAGVQAGQTSNYVDTGWAPVISGSLSIACWLKIDPAASWQSLNGLFSTVPAGIISCFQVSTLVIFTIPGVGTITNSYFVPMARAGWTHLALVIDAATRQSTLYVNGIGQLASAFAVTPSWTATGFQIGHYNNSANLALDIDEFILANRAMTAAEIAVLAADPRGADAAFGTSSGPTFAGNGQRPIPGNQSYGLVLNANAGAAWLVFGTSRCTMAGGTINLPVDLGLLHPLLAGLQGQVDSNLGALSLLVSGGATQVPFPLPNLPGLSGFQCYGQALTLDAASLQFASSNALAIGIGR